MSRVKLHSFVFVFLYTLFFSNFAFGAPMGDGTISFDTLRDSKELLDQQVIEKHKFYGFASYFNGISFFVIGPGQLKPVESGQKVTLGTHEWFAAVGRFNVLVVKSPGTTMEVNKRSFEIEPFESNSLHPEAYIVPKPELASISPELDQLRYSYLWFPLAALAKTVEWFLVKIHEHVVSHWGLTIIVFAFLLKILLLPVGVMTVRFQRRVSQYQTILLPQLAEIKSKYKGEEAHNQIMLAHRALGISPFYKLKPMLGLLIQLPILIAIFNPLGEMPQFSGASFLWMDNLAYPDVIANLPIVIPAFGNQVSFLPFLMIAVMFFSTIIFQNRHAPAAEVKRQKLNLYIMGVVFLVLFYPFPAAMVFYWTFANALHIVQQQVIRI